MHLKSGIALLAVVVLFQDAGVVKGQSPAPRPETGVVVEKVERGREAWKAGLQPGDQILSWSSQAGQGPVQSPFHLSGVESQQSLRSDVTLSGLRGSRPMTWVLARYHWWRIDVRPLFPASVEPKYQTGSERIAAGDLAGGEALWRTVIVDLQSTGHRIQAAWLLTLLAEKIAAARSWDLADQVYAEALEALQGETDLRPQIQILVGWGNNSLIHNAWDRAAEDFQRALILERQTGSRSVHEPDLVAYLADAAWYKGDLAKAEKLYPEALALYQERAPESLNLASALNNWSNVLVDGGDLDQAEQNLHRADAIVEKIEPGSTLQAEILSNLGVVMWYRADLVSAETLFRRSLAISEKWNLERGDILRSLNNLGEVAEKRGDLATAEELLLRSLRLVDPGSLELVDLYASLGQVAQDRGDLEVAEQRFGRSLEMAEARIPESPKLAEILRTFAVLERERGRYAEARSALRRALAIQKRLAPGSVQMAETLVQLAAVELVSHRSSAAEEGFQRAQALLRSQAPGSPVLAQALRGLGDVAARRGDPRGAIVLYRQAVEQQEKTGTDTAVQAKLLHVLGRAERAAGLADEGRRHLCEALDVLDRQRRKLGGTGEVRATFEASNRDLYSGCLEALLAQGRNAEAFATLERGRARSFLDLLAERDLAIPGLSTAAETERRRIDTEYDRLQETLLKPTPGAKPAELQEKLRDLQTQQEQLIARIRRESPHFASLRYPKPLALAGVRAALDSGTVLLEYSVGPENVWLFAIQSADVAGSGLSVFRIALDARKLREEVEGFRRLLTRPGSDRSALRTRAQRLYRVLMQPAAGLLAKGQRILVSPDGPLHTLPFAALVRGDHYLIEWKPVHSALSATVYAELRQSRPVQWNPTEERLDSFGDPAYPRAKGDQTLDPEVRELLRRGLNLTPLPSTRKEVQAISTLFPQSHEYLGPDATEERAKALGSDSRLIHFACHGLIDEQFPLNSALALSMPEHPAEGQDNGLLQAWEIFESVRLDADLVTLSACDTALGKEMGGEGLIGLTRAFQYAGARSVLASLWGIADYSTADFMKAFYSHLRARRSKDEALRAAQIDQIRKKSGSSHPFYWAAFQLTGDWR